jgi:hypothetical protein
MESVIKQTMCALLIIKPGNEQNTIQGMQIALQAHSQLKVARIRLLVSPCASLCPSAYKNSRMCEKIFMKFYVRKFYKNYEISEF